MIGVPGGDEHAVEPLAVAHIGRDVAEATTNEIPVAADPLHFPVDNQKAAGEQPNRAEAPSP